MKMIAELIIGTTWKPLDNGKVFEYILRKNYLFVASVPVPMFSNSSIYIINYILYLLNN